MTRLDSHLSGRWPKTWPRRRPGSSGAVRSPARRLAVEALEDRTTPTRVAVVAASPFAGDVKTTLVATGQFASSDIDLIDANTSTPTLATLNNYDSVLVFCDLAYLNPNQLGDNLASYVSGGRGVVTATFNFFNSNGLLLGGAWAAGGYSPFDGASQSQGVPLTLGAVAQPDHPVMAGVNTFSGGTSSFHNLVTVAPGASLIASWSNGQPLVAEKDGLGGRIVGLNFFPPSSNIRPDFWDASTDGGTLLANAVKFVEHRDPVANAGGPYSVPEGGSVLLSGAGSAADPGASIVKYEWDFDYTGIFAADFTSTTNPTAPFSAAGLDGPGSRTVALRVTDNFGQTSLATATVAITNVAPVAHPDPFSVFEEQSITGDLRPAVFDPAGPLDPLTFTLVAGPQHAREFALQGDGEFTYAPETNFSGPDSFTVRVDDGDGGETTFDVRVDVTPVNDPPVGAADGYSVAEDTTLTVTAPGVLANDTDVDGDALTAVLASGPAHGTLTLNADGSFTYRPAADYFGADGFTYLPNDGTANGAPVAVDLTVTPVNDPPVAVADSVSTDEDAAASGNVLANDTDVDGDALTAALVDGPAHGTLALRADGSFTYTPEPNYNGPDAFTYEASDGRGGTARATASITVTPVDDAPVADAGPDRAGSEGGAVTLDGSHSFDVDDTDLTYSWDFGDGTTGAGADPSHAYADNGTYTATLTVTDPSGASGTDTVTVTVANVAPAVTAAANQSASEGAAATFDLGSFADPGANDGPWAVTVSWGDGTTDAFAAAAPGPLGTRSHTYADNGTYTVTVTVSDKDDDSGSAAFQVAVANVDPVLSVSGPATVVEGSAYNLSLGSVIDPGRDAVTAYTIHWGDGTSDTFAGSPAGLTKTHTYADGAAGGTPRTVTVDLTDDDGPHPAAGSAAVTVTNAPPVIDTVVTPADPVAAGSPSPVRVTGTFHDPGTGDTHTAVWSWGDGSTTPAGPGDLTEGGGSGSVAGQHFYTAPGVYTVTLTVTDKDGATVSRAATNYVVVYDATAGLAAGAGWLTSSAGAYAANPSLTGTAFFGFVARYSAGSSVPVGITEFLFPAAGFEFRSTSYDWLVVSGARAQYQGSGTVNGAGSYGFLLTVIDGQRAGGGGVDRFRLKVWNKATGQVVYDNQPGAPDSADPTAALRGGSIQLLG